MNNSGHLVDRPNVLLIVGEDTGRHLGCYGDPDVVTPNLDRLANEGVRFEHAIAVAPVCAPSRSAFVTGQYPQRIGTHHMRSTLRNPPQIFPQLLRDAGYHVNWFGKTDFNFEPDLAFADQGGWRDEGTDWLPALAAGRMPRQPWFAYVNLGITHESGMWPPMLANAGPPYGARYKICRDRPDVFPVRCDPATVTVPSYLPDTQTVREDIARHAENVAYLDRQVGEILNALDRSGQRDRTIVAFVADHGRGLPREKRWPYPAGLGIPLIVRWPDYIQPGRVDDSLVSGVDLAPTILSLTNTPIPDTYDGRAVLGSMAVDRRDIVFAGRDRMDEAFDRVRVARTQCYHYIRNYYPLLPCAQRVSYMERMPTMNILRQLHATGRLTGNAALFMQAIKPAEELYDLRSDPHCVHNLADDSAYESVRSALASRLDAWIADIDDLGAVPERELVGRALVTDRIEEYRTRIKTLPVPLRIGPAQTLIEMHEAEQFTSSNIS